MTKDAPAFDFYPERWLVGVAGMSDAEQLAYLRLLCHQWLMGDSGLPADVPALKRLAGARGVTDAVLAKIPTGQDGKRRNARLEIIRSEQRQRIAKRREGAAKTNAKRWGDKVASESLSDHSATPERFAVESPPPTSHLPPREIERAAQVREGSFPSLEEVKTYAPTVMAPPECAENFWNSMEGGGWVNKFGHPIADWKPIFRNFATAWKNNDAQRKQKDLLNPSAKKPKYTSCL